MYQIWLIFESRSENFLMHLQSYNFSLDLGSLAGLAETWLERTKHNLIQFWQNTVANEKVLDEMLYVSALCKCAKSNRSEETSDESCTTKCSICCLNISKHKPAKSQYFPALLQL